MKKVIAIILSIIMTLSVFAVPVSAQEVTTQAQSTQSQSNVDEAFETVDNVLNNVQLILEMVVDIIKAVHELVGTILSMVGEVCPMCGKLHDLSLDLETPDFEIPEEPEEPDNVDSSAEEYFKNNSQIVDIIKVEESEDILPENEVTSFLEERGLSGYQITYSYSIDGEYGDSTVISESSEDKHPTYQTIYVSENGEAWIIDIVNGAVFANPFDFNIESDLGVQVLLSESEEFTSYDSATNQFFVTIPNDSAIIKILVDDINAETLDTFTIEEICKICGVDVSEITADDESDSEIIQTFSFTEQPSLHLSAPNTHASVEDPFIIVSLGDSYSSGEGIEPFYGQNKPLAEKVKDYDWLAHRSKKSWPSLLTVSGETTDTRKMSNYRVANGSASSADIQWYFAAVSGAETKHFKDAKQKKEYNKFYNVVQSYEDTVYLPKQLDVFNNISGEVDYVTLTIGGNDVGFTDIVTTCAKNSSYLYWGKTSKLEDTFEELWNNIGTYKSRLKQAYKDVEAAAGEQAEIIVAGYPELLDYNGKGTVINEHEAYLVNQNVKEFNWMIRDLVNSCRNEGMNIHFVDIVEKFAGHQAYSANAWLNKIKFGPRGEDLEDITIASAYSMHPNEEGAKAYAECVNAKIKELEGTKNVGTLSGKVCKASDRTTPITDATIEIAGNNIYKEFSPDSNGNYSKSLSAGTYQVKVTADGYIDFNAYATVEKDLNTYMETFLMVEGEEGETGTAVGSIQNALTGTGLEGVNLEVRVGWNNADNGTVITTTTTDSSGNYSLTLPLGNYTLCASKNGFVSTTINIIVQKDVLSTRVGAMTPLISGNKFRIVLTWGENPEDLDSHVVGTLNNGDNFHVYYSHMSEHDGSVEVCNLDVDDTTSYGPETITLNTTTETPYYYYIYHYSGYGSLATSNAQINLYQGENLVATFNVPTDQGNSRYWNVFAIKNGELVVNNTITSSPNVTY